MAKHTSEYRTQLFHFLTRIEVCIFITCRPATTYIQQKQRSSKRCVTFKFTLLLQLNYSKYILSNYVVSVIVIQMLICKVYIHVTYTRQFSLLIIKVYALQQLKGVLSNTFARRSVCLSVRFV